jgi:serine/threonine protein kinase
MNLFGYKDDKIIVIVLENIVIKIYNKEKINNIGTLINLLDKEKPDYLEYINGINKFNDYYIVCSRTIIPIVKIEIDESYNRKIVLNPLYLSKQPNDKQRLLEHIALAIDYLHSKGWSHEDINFDNVGYDPNSDQYRVFDFEESKILTKVNENNDYNRFHNLGSLYDEYQFS